MDIQSAIIARVDEFPTLPTIYQAISDVMANPRSTAQHLADVISEDQAAASKILKAANSSIYGYRGRVTTISQAITYIGFDEVRNLVMAMGIIDLFKQSSNNGNFNPVELWMHSIGVGVISRNIGKTIGALNIENYFLAGILHDIGKLLFYKAIPDLYVKAINYAIENNLTAREAELEIVGVSHTVAGELIAEKWKLPVSIRDVIKFHEIGKVEGNYNILVTSVHIANVAAAMFNLGQAGDDVVQMPNIDTWEALNLPDKFFTQNLNKIMLEFEEASALLLLA